MSWSSRLHLSAAACLAVLAANGPVHAAPQAPTRVLLLPMDVPEKLRPTADLVEAAIMEELARTPHVQARGARDIEKLLAHEQRAQLLGCTTPECAVDLAGTMTADQLLTATLHALGDATTLTLARVRPRDGASLARQSTRFTQADLVAAVRKATREVMVDPAPPQLRVELRVLARRAGSRDVVVLQGGEQLKQGDEVAFELNVNLDAHVYLVQRTHASGAVNVIFPQVGTGVENPLRTGARVRIPAGEDFYEVDNQDLGTEHVYLVASPHELPRLAHAMAPLMADGVQTMSVEKAENALLALAGDRKGATRGLKLKPPAGSLPLTATLQNAPGDDAVFYTFSFEHVAAAAR